MTGPGLPAAPPKPKSPPEGPAATSALVLSEENVAAIAAAAATAAVAAQKEAEKASRRGGRLKRAVMAVGTACAVLLGTVSVSIPAPHVPWDTSYSDRCLSYETDMAGLLDKGLYDAARALHTPSGCPSSSRIVNEYRQDHPAGFGNSSP